MLNSFKLSLQYILRKLWVTRLAGGGASKRAGWLTKLVIDLFVKYYKVDMKEAQKPDTASYRTFNEFFVRPLRDEVRPIDTDPNVLVMPADGVISQLGKIEEDKITTITSSGEASKLFSHFDWRNKRLGYWRI